MSRRAWWKRVVRLEEAMAPEPPPEAPWTTICSQLSEDGLHAVRALLKETEGQEGVPEDRLFQILMDGAFGPEMFEGWMKLIGKGELAADLWREYMRTYNEKARMRWDEYLKTESGKFHQGGTV